MIKLVVMDVDGVLTDGKQYMNGNDLFLKSVSFKDLDAIHGWKKEGYQVAVITGEKNAFTAWLKKELSLDYFIEGCKDKVSVLENILENLGIYKECSCYIGDGKYDIPALKSVGLAVCPADAIVEVKEVCDLVLTCNGGQGCMAELFSYIKRMGKKDKVQKIDIEDVVSKNLMAHRQLIMRICEDEKLQGTLYHVCDLLGEAAIRNKKILICGNGGSAADAQHFAAELVGRFYHERRAINAEALTVNSSVMTAIGNDYDYNRIFARQVEAKGKKDDILIGISTSGNSENIVEAFRLAKKMGMTTILLSGIKAEKCKAAEWTDELLAIPSEDTPRIQEMHILFIHIMCQLIEERILQK